VSICLSMIVRNEAERLRTCLESVAAHIDYAVIVDTGSDDGTAELALSLLDELGIAGEVHEVQWTDFASARNRALELARGRCDYILILDADNTVHSKPGAFEHLSADIYAYRLSDGDMLWEAERLVRDDPQIHWHWRGEVHERLVADKRLVRERLDQVLVLAQGMGAERDERWRRDLPVLRRMHAEYPDDLHTMLHLANVLLRAGERAEAHELYRRLLQAELDSSDAVASERRYIALWHLGETAEDAAQQLHWLHLAMQARPRRLEAAWSRLRLLARLGRHDEAFALTNEILQDATPIPEDRMMVMPRIYQWGIVHERALAAARLGYLDEAVRALEFIMRAPDVPAAVRDQSRENLSRVHAARAASAARNP
jgi:tetratricopeptide (TPR) repeat protein